jgi:hypothetical protein
LVELLRPSAGFDDEEIRPVKESLEQNSKKKSLLHLFTDQGFVTEEGEHTVFAPGVPGARHGLPCDFTSIKWPSQLWARHREQSKDEPSQGARTLAVGVEWRVVRHRQASWRLLVRCARPTGAECGAACGSSQHT